jgi:hypothetical protein
MLKHLRRIALLTFGHVAITALLLTSELCELWDTRSSSQLSQVCLPVAKGAKPAPPVA